MNKSSAKWAALFDWDGVIIDSSTHHEESWERLAREIDQPLPEGHFQKSFGRKNEFIIPEILAWTTEATRIRELSLRKEALYREVVAERNHTLEGPLEFDRRVSRGRTDVPGSAHPTVAQPPTHLPLPLEDVGDDDE